MCNVPFDLVGCRREVGLSMTRRIVLRALSRQLPQLVEHVVGAVAAVECRQEHLGAVGVLDTNRIRKHVGRELLGHLAHRVVRERELCQCVADELTALPKARARSGTLVGPVRP